jgi:hypothetical protein
MKRVIVSDIEPLVDEKHGNVAAIARALGFSRTAVKNCVNKSPVLKEAIDQARQGMLDNVESSLYHEVLAGNVTAMIFWLKCQGKERGWVERQEIAGADGAPLFTQVVRLPESVSEP